MGRVRRRRGGWRAVFMRSGALAESELRSERVIAPGVAVLEPPAASDEGVFLIALGILCLCLSDAVAATGSWWQSTLDAFGVGFVVGGVVDVLAISALNQVLSGEEKRRANNAEARAILRSGMELWSIAPAAAQLLERSGKDIDPDLRDRLLDMVAEYELEERRKGVRDDVLPPRELRLSRWSPALGQAAPRRMAPAVQWISAYSSAPRSAASASPKVTGAISRVDAVLSTRTDSIFSFASTRPWSSLSASADG